MFRRPVPACLTLALSLALSLAASWAMAQPLAQVPPPPRLADPAAPASTPAPVSATARAASAPVLASTQPPAQARAPARAASAVPSNTRVIEDDEVRIEESRGKQGQLQRITVRNKASGGKAYEIIVGPPGQDPSQPRGTTGQRAWSLFDF